MRVPHYLAGLCLAAVAATSVAAPQPPRFETAARSVRLDGVRLGTDLTPSGYLNSLRFTVAYDPVDAQWHLWTLTANPGVYPTSGFALSDVVHATSADGYDFTSTGTLSYGPGGVLPANFGATIDPPVSYLRAVKAGGRMLSLNYAFFPGYPIAMAIAAWPIRWIGLTQIAGSTLGGVVVSLVAALFAMFAIVELTGKDPDNRADGIRAATYLLIFPSGFFLAQVFTESLFLALALWCLVFARRGNWLAAGALAIGVTLTRATGVALVVPLAYLAWQAWDSAAGRARVLSILAAAVPVIVFAAWRISPLGQSFAAVEQAWFGREFLSIGKSFYNAYQAVVQMTSKNTQATIYFALEFAAIALAAAGCIGVARRHPDIALFSAAVLVGSLTSGYIQSMVRYTLTMPAMFFWLAQLGRRPAFDRGWSFASTLLLGMLAMLFTFDMWVA